MEQEKETLSKINKLSNYIKPKMRYNSIYNLYEDILIDYDIESYHSFCNLIDEDSNVISVMTEGLICCIKVLCNHKNKKELIQKYIENTIYLLTETYYYSDNHISLIYAIKTLFRTKKRNLSHLFDLNFKDMEYYTIQKNIDILLYDDFSFHSGYINLVTLAFYAFILTTKDMNNSLNTAYLKCVYDFLQFQKKNDICFFDEPHKQKTMINLDTINF